MRRTLLLAVIPLLTLGCQQASEEEAEPVATTAVAEAPTVESLTRFDARIDPILAEMTLEEKIGQMTQPDKDYLVEESDIATYFLGSILSGGDSDPSPENTFEEWRDMAERLNGIARETRLGIPLIYGVDAVHGHNNVVGAVIYPHNIGLGASRDADLVERVYRATAVEVRATGIHWDFAPAVTVPRDERWGRTYEGFAEDPSVADELGGAAVRGLQGNDLSDPTSVVACAKHFAGDGGTVYGTGTQPSPAGPPYPMDRGDVQLDEEEFRRIHVAPYKQALAAGVGTIMPSFSSWNGVKCSANKALLTGMLKEEMGFEGFLISDWAAIDEIPGDYASDIEISINAGMDMVMVPDRYREFFDTLKGLVEEGKVPMERIDDAVRRILRVKFAFGMMDDDYDHRADPALAERVGSAEHRAIGREAVQKSLVVLQNGGALPLSKEATRIHVAGRGADDLGRQLGGWSITWQGANGETTVGTTILQGLREVAPDVEITYSLDGSGAEGADVAVVVIGEDPYAEMNGDRTNLDLHADDAAIVERVAATGVPVVTVLISGRPLILGETLEQSDAFVAAWLPGTEGQGVADVLFGDVSPTGKLGYSWPRSIDQLPINVGDADYDPLFAYDFGLTY